MVDIDSQSDIGVARILSAGVHFFTTQQKLLKIDSCSGWGVHLVSCEGALTHFSCKLGLKKIFFTALGGTGAPTAPPLATPMQSDRVIDMAASIILNDIKMTVYDCEQYELPETTENGDKFIPSSLKRFFA